jgi:flagellin
MTCQTNETQKEVTNIMSLRIATNVQSLAAQRFLTMNHDEQNRSLERLSSGSRINRAGDDAAGLAISEKFKANIRSLRQDSRNANDGVSMVQTAEGAMNEISNIFVRLRELSIQGASDTIGDTERGFINKEVQQLKSEVDRISNSTEFNGTKLLNGSAPSLDIQIGTQNRASVDRFVFDSKSLTTNLSTFGLEDISTMSKDNARDNLEHLDMAINHLNENRATIGALQNRLQSAINNLGIYTENLEGANSRIRDTDMAEETANLTKSNILSQANVSVLGQANQNPQLALKLLG